jgi:hypothetical protein
MDYDAHASYRTNRILETDLQMKLYPTEIYKRCIL